MAEPNNHGTAWSSADDARLRDLAARDTPTGLIANRLGRTEQAIYSRASELGISLKPTNQSPYNRRK